MISTFPQAKGHFYLVGWTDWYMWQ